MLPLVFLPGGGLVDGDLPEDNSSSVGTLLSETMGSFLYCELLDVQHDRHLLELFKVRGFFLPGIAADHSHVVSF